MIRFDPIPGFVGHKIGNRFPVPADNKRLAIVFHCSQQAEEMVFGVTRVDGLQAGILVGFSQSCQQFGDFGGGPLRIQLVRNWRRDAA